MKSNIKVTLANRRLAQPHNAYNIYFILERYKLIHEMEWSCGTGAVQHHPQISYDLAGYDFLTLPDLPPPHQNLQLPLGWFVPGKNSKRKHRKTPGCELFDIDAAIFARSLLSALFCHFRPSRHHMTVTSFAELARTVAANWKSADKETKEYCVEVARILKKRHTELTKVGGLICLSPIDSVSPGPTEEAKPRNFDNETKDTELTKFGAVFCLPGMDSASPGPKNETNQQKATYDIQELNINDSDILGMWHSTMPSDVIQDMQLMAGSARIQTGTYHQEVTQEFRAFMNASRRATISSMMTLPGRALMNPLLRRYSAPECRSFKERHTELTPPPIDPGRKGTLTFCPQT